MNKYFMSLVFATQTMFIAQADTVNPFAKLTPKMYKQANSWAEKVVTTLNDDLQLTYLNLFALNAEDSVQTFIKCAEFVESQPDMLPLYEKLGDNIMNVIRQYAESVQEKIALKKNISDKEKESLWQQLQIKVQELVVYINAIYYQTLYNHMAKRGTAAKYMFDENGIIAKEKRTRSLPQPK
jgi:septum formation topological specificity factor MinE